MAAQMSTSTVADADDQWSRLPGDLLGVIYDKIASPLDRVRFKAVSRSWRDAASGQRPAPTFPWLVLSPYEDGTAERVFCPVDGALLRVPLPPEAAGKRLVGFHDGGWIAATSDVDGGDSLVIVNLFSGIEVPLSAVQRTTRMIRKLVFSESPTSKSCILAANLRGALAVCRVGCRERGWWKSNAVEWFHDIAFCHGKLYGLTSEAWMLFIFDIRMTKKGSAMVTLTHKLPMNLPKNRSWVRYEYGGGIASIYNMSYLVKHMDRLFIALRVHWIKEQESYWTTTENECFFKVFELINTDDTRSSWKELTTLGQYALFLSATCCRVVHVLIGRHGGIEKNRIYYNHRCSIIEDDYICDDVHLRRCDNGHHLYHVGEQDLDVADGIKSVGYYVAGGGDALGWLLPPDF